ncbi:hypothetical protein E2P81_ATG05994 [Venturia nashicola]|uniref:Uncharacterized protein n=1 Tax=Venturia nashicola TaxID=86259 RepID=A0A4Z1NTC8_9PEZI|nr:hypothetical protein E6O75_ATG06137 [Venturia nashicola]TLD29700.1 hypothetical protein E2P81_ATG05994 [Venturia nashicola]
MATQFESTHSPFKAPAATPTACMTPPLALNIIPTGRGLYHRPWLSPAAKVSVAAVSIVPQIVLDQLQFTNPDDASVVMRTLFRNKNSNIEKSAEWTTTCGRTLNAK